MMLLLAAATVIIGAPCGLMNPDMTSVATTGHVVITQFGPQGNGIVVCRGQVDPPGIPMRLDYANTGITCGAGLNGTTDWQELITPDGRASLVCRLVGR